VSKVSLRPVHHGRNVAGRRPDGRPGADVKVGLHNGDYSSKQVPFEAQKNNLYI